MRCLRKLRDDQRGSVSVIFAVAFLPMALGVCAAIEISQAYLMRERLDHAVSASVDAWRQSGPETGAAPIAHRVFENYAQSFPSNASAELNLVLTDESAKFTARATLKTRFLPAFGIDDLDLTSSRVEKLNRR